MRPFGPLDRAGNFPAPIFRVYAHVEDWFPLNRAFHVGVGLYSFPYLVFDKRFHIPPGVVFNCDSICVKVPAVVPFLTLLVIDGSAVLQ